MNIKSLILFSFFIFNFFNAISQPAFPPNAPLFDSSAVARVDIFINPDTLDWIYENVESDIEFHADFTFNNGTINESVEDVGFRLRGNTSRYSQKKSFKVSFNAFFPGRKFYGIEKMNLNGEHNDPSIIRARLCWEWLRLFNVPAPRSTHVEVYINGNYYGLYIMVEHVDEEFIDSRFGNNDGNLYLCLWPADLGYLGNDPDLYKFAVGDRRAYELKNNTQLDDYSDFAHFVDVLNNTPASQLACELEKVFNLQDYLKIIALDIFTGNWDGYIYNKNNFYLYHNTETGKFEYIPYDLDNTFGIDWFDRDWGTRNIYDWEQHGSEVRPLYTRLLDVPELRAQYTYYFNQLLERMQDEDSLFAYITGIRNMISPYVVNDPYHSLDYGYSYQDFLNSYDIALGQHVKYGLKPYLTTRTASALQQVEEADMDPAINYIESSRAIPGKEYWVRAYVEDEDPAPSVRLYYRINWGMAEYIPMVDDGEHHDREAGDRIYGGVLPPFQFNQTLSWQVTAIDSYNHASTLPCSPAVVSFYPSSDPQLFINEFMASNNTTIADEYGDYDDWVEIYNADDEAVWLGDKYLADNLSNPDKWPLPDYTLQPGSFLLVWADEETDEGPFHASFKLDADGEELGIFDNETTGYFLIDSVTWGMQDSDTSFGRQTDGSTAWINFTSPTPGYSNNASDIPEGDLHPGSNLVVFPNPVAGGVLHFSDPFTGDLFDMLGNKVWSGRNELLMNLGSLPDGIYIVRDIRGATVKVMKLSKE